MYMYMYSIAQGESMKALMSHHVRRAAECRLSSRIGEFGFTGVLHAQDLGATRAQRASGMGGAMLVAMSDVTRDAHG